MLDSKQTEMIEKFAGREVEIDSQRPELARFAGLRGRIVTFNRNGNALVVFEGSDQTWREIHPDFLALADKED